MTGSYSDLELMKHFSDMVGGEVDLVFIRKFRQEMRRYGRTISNKSFKELLIEYFNQNL